MSAIQLTLSSECSLHYCADAKSSNADRMTGLFARVRHGKSKPRPVLAHRRSIAANFSMETNCCSRDRCGTGYRRWRQIFHYLCWHGVKHGWSRRNVLHDTWTERSGRVDGAPINRNEERVAKEHGRTNCEACHRRIIEIGVHCRLQHGEDKQESHHELTVTRGIGRVTTHELPPVNSWSETSNTSRTAPAS